jgi:ribose transport system permease protein
VSEAAVAEQVTGAQTSGASVRRGLNPRDVAARYGVLVTLVGMIVVFSLLKPHVFPTSANLKAVLAEMAPVAVVSFGLTVVLIMGDFDLSIVGMIGLADAVVVSLVAKSGVPVVVALIAGLGLAVVVGGFNGTLVARFGASSFIVTLAIGQVLTGIELQITDGQTIFQGIPQGFLNIATGTPILGIQNAVWIALAVFVALYLLLDHTALGRYMYAIGGNQEAARLSGIRIRWWRVLGFVIVSASCVLSSVLLAGQASAYSHDLGSTFFLPTYAAVFLGAAVIRPGTFTIVGTLIGTVFLEVVSNGLTILSLDTSVVSIVQGTLLAVAVILSTLQRGRS